MHIKFQKNYFEGECFNLKLKKYQLDLLSFKFFLLNGTFL